MVEAASFSRLSRGDLCGQISLQEPEIFGTGGRPDHLHRPYVQGSGLITASDWPTRSPPSTDICITS